MPAGVCDVDASTQRRRRPFDDLARVDGSVGCTIGKGRSIEAQAAKGFGNRAVRANQNRALSRQGQPFDRMAGMVFTSIAKIEVIDPLRKQDNGHARW